LTTQIELPQQHQGVADMPKLRNDISQMSVRIILDGLSELY
jgi:hypothetical protein